MHAILVALVELSSKGIDTLYCPEALELIEYGL